MNMKQAVLCAITALMGGAVQAGVLTIDSAAPADSSPVSYGGNNKGTNIKNDDLTRGNTFLMPENSSGTTWSLSELAVRKRSNYSENNTNDTIKLWLFEWDPDTDGTNTANWVYGDGIGDDDPLDGTGMTNLLVDGEVFDLPASISDDEYLHFDYSGSPLILKENTAYGFLLQYRTDGTAGAGSINFTLEAGNPGGYADGILLGLTTSTNSVIDTQDLAFWIVTLPTASDLVLAPSDQLEFLVGSSSTLLTNMLDASITYGLDSNSVSIASVDIINEQHAGAFSVVDFPASITNPAPASEPITIQFDQGVAGLSKGESSSASVQVVWNGGTLSTSTVPLLAIFDHTGLSNNFDGNDANDTGPGFFVAWNATDGGNNNTSDAATGLIQFTDNGGSGTPAVGLVASNRINLASAPGFAITWEIESTDPISTTANGWFFGVQDSIGNQADGSSLWNRNPAIALGLRITEGDGLELVETPEGTGPVATELFADGTLDPGSYTNGFTVAFTVNSDDTWSATTTGLSPELSTNGTLSTVFYSDIAGTLYASTFLQSSSSQTQTVHYASVSLFSTEAATPAVISITPGTGGAFSIYGSNMAVSATYKLQGSDSLVFTNWMDIASVSGVSEIDWADIIAPTNDAGFFRVISE